MSHLNLSVKHGQTWEVARANFETGVTEAASKLDKWIQRVEWSPDRTSAKLIGTGFEIEMRVDPEDVHATGSLPFFAKLIEAPLKHLIHQTFHKQLP